MKYKRIFVIVCDSLGIGALDDASKYGDEGTNTFVHIANECNGLNIPNLNALGVGDLADIKGTSKVDHIHSFVTTLREASNGKDTMTGHWEMMGVKTTKPFKTFTDTGFPEELIKELEEKFNRKIIGNCSASGTEIIKRLGEQQNREGSLIVYTSADSVLQIAAHEEVVKLEELYRDCEIAREICNRPEYRLGRIIARPYIGQDASTYKRTPNRHDYALSPTSRTMMEELKENGYEVSCVGKIADIFNNVGVTKTVHTVSNADGMDKTIAYVKDDDFTGLCFVNLVEFDSEYGHRRNSLGYGKAIEEFDVKLGEMLKYLKDDDLVIITADHGNDPTHVGTDHTRERVPFIAYSKKIIDGRKISERSSFADIGATVLANFNLEKSKEEIGEPIEELLR